MVCENRHVSGEKPSSAVHRLVGVYNADGTLLGELRYFVAARLGRAHCPLCDITHGRVRERSEWRNGRGRLPVPFETYHRNDQPARLRDSCDALPIVVADTDDGFVVLLRPDDLAACDGSVERLVSAVEDASTKANLTWPA
jgi:hypothetical protein